MTKPKHCYAVIVYWSERDGAFIAEAPELPGSAADGPTYQEAITNLEVVMDEWIEIATEKGWAINGAEGSTTRAGLFRKYDLE